MVAGPAFTFSVFRAPALVTASVATQVAHEVPRGAASFTWGMSTYGYLEGR
jgi:hypothetical protein